MFTRWCKWVLSRHSFDNIFQFSQHRDRSRSQEWKMDRHLINRLKHDVFDIPGNTVQRQNAKT